MSLRRRRSPSRRARGCAVPSSLIAEPPAASSTPPVVGVRTKAAEMATRLGSLPTSAQPVVEIRRARSPRRGGCGAKRRRVCRDPCADDREAVVKYDASAGAGAKTLGPLTAKIFLHRKMHKKSGEPSLEERLSNARTYSAKTAYLWDVQDLRAHAESNGIPIYERNCDGELVYRNPKALATGLASAGAEAPPPFTRPALLTKGKCARSSYPKGYLQRVAMAVGASEERVRGPALYERDGKTKRGVPSIEDLVALIREGDSSVLMHDGAFPEAPEGECSPRRAAAHKWRSGVTPSDYSASLRDREIFGSRSTTIPMAGPSPGGGF